MRDAYVSLSGRSELMMTYAMCGFANLGSLGIMIGGLATMAPERRDEVVSLGAKTAPATRSAISASMPEATS